MIVTHKLSVDLAEKGKSILVSGVHGDSARALELELLAQGEPWQIPQEAAVCIRYEKPDGTGGSYDTLPDGTKAWGAQGNTLFVALAPQVCSVKGPVTLQITLVLGQLQVSTFAMVLQVERELSGEGDSEDYTNLAAWLAEFGGAGGHEHVLDKNNPHIVTKEQLGLGQVDNTPDMDKPLSTASRQYVDLRTNDYIVEQGMQDVAGGVIWSYKKWQSGRTELWGDYFSTSHTDDTEIALPFTVTSSYTAVCPTFILEDTLPCFYAGQTYDDYVKVFTRKTDGTANPKAGCRILIFGAWKSLDYSGLDVQDYLNAQLEVIENGAY